MKTNVRLGLRVLRGIPDFLKSAIAVPTTIGPLSGLIDRLNALIGRIDVLMSEQEASARAIRGAALRNKELSQKLLGEHVRPVARMGKLLFPKGATVRAELKAPKGKPSYQAIIAIADGMADRVEEHKAKFVEEGFGENFIDTMRSTAEELRVSLKDKTTFMGHRSAATSGIALEYARGREMVRLLDDVVAPLLKGSKHLAEWKTLTRFARETKREVKEEAQGADTRPTPTPETPGESPIMKSADHAA